MKKGTIGKATAQIDASPEALYDLVSNVKRMGEWSPECRRCEWLDGATGPAVGARFRGHVKRNGIGPVYWAPCKVTTCVPGEDFGFSVYAGRKPANTWRYQLREKDGGTEVTESFELPAALPTRVYWALLGWARGRTNERGMRETLERIKAVAEADAA